ncbi:hypothetical protein Ppa06_64620 [Planomonospora parontospora subsp. parontospora]|uniref:Uncharacterized protein n=2 Tax=Planomonospora parontospora TaxID=58119 RepID=A0AA37BMW5_9ACTN|nr:hypothetical protein [Planomonospora parontospora]GGK94266.1 hypothetical protein GCM10010126_62080 [Planomonospora parontospora]GII12664.1 hypothetical protein Ppa06_64620 [Planomonospora parontospora subsp. parontospora]
MTRVESLEAQMLAFDTAEVVAGHAALDTYLENVQTLARTLALMLNQDGELAATWLRNRRLKKGRIPVWVRAALARRTRGHSRNAADALLEAVSALQKMAALHADYEAQERAAPPKG